MKKILLISLLFIGNSLFSLDGKCEQGDCVSGEGIFALIDGRRYKGKFEGSNLNGFGTILIPEDKLYSIYSGYFRDGVYEGDGVFVYSSGDKYSGEFKNGKIDGFGKAESIQGDIYIGEFKDQHFNGFGVYQYKNQTKYIGEFRDGKPEALGIYLAENSVYAGEMFLGNIKPDRGYLITNLEMDSYGAILDGKLSDKKKYTVYQSGKYAGPLNSNGNPDGFGVYSSLNSYYVGNFKNGLLEGKGILISSNKTIYYGEFFNGKFHGNGNIYSKNGEIITKGKWFLGKLENKE